MKDMKIMKGGELSGLSTKVIACVIEVRNTLGFGLLELAECFMNRLNITHEANTVISSSPSCSSW